MPAIMGAGVTIRSAISAQYANTIIFSLLAAEPITKLQWVYADSTTTIRRSENANGLKKATVIGIALNDAAEDESVQIQALGILEDASFLYSNGDRLYLGSSPGEAITTVPTSGEYLTVLGWGLGLGKIYIRPEQPILRI